MHYGIIAAGEGSRLAQEGVELPKPLVKINGKPMIGRLLDIFMEQGAESIAVIVNRQMTEVAEYLRGRIADSTVKIDMVVKSTPSSMHSFYELASVLESRGRFILTTVDTIFRREDFSRYAEAYAQAPAEVDGMMAVTSFIDDEKPLYVAADKDMRIRAFRDTAEADTNFISGGIYGLNSSAFGVLRHCIDTGVSRMRNFQRALISSGLDIRAFDMGKIIDVDHAGDIRKACEFLNS